MDVGFLLRCHHLVPLTDCVATVSALGFPEAAAEGDAAWEQP